MGYFGKDSVCLCLAVNDFFLNHGLPTESVFVLLLLLFSEKISGFVFPFLQTKDVSVKRTDRGVLFSFFF